MSRDEADTILRHVSELLLNHLALSNPEHFSDYTIPCDLPGYFVVQRSCEYVNLSSLDQFVDYIKRACITCNVQRCPLLRTTYLFKVECFSLHLIQDLVDGEHPADGSQAVALCCNVNCSPAALIFCVELCARKN